MNPCDIELAAGELIGEVCACGHLDLVHARRDEEVVCDVCRAVAPLREKWAMKGDAGRDG